MLARLRHCLQLLPARERWRWSALIPLAVAAAGLEALGALAVFALLGLVRDPSAAASTPLLAPLASTRGGTLIAAATAVALFYIFKNVALTAMAAAHDRIVSDSVVAASSRMLQGYLAAPVAEHLRRNSAELIRNTTHSVQTAFREVMEPACAAVTEASIAAAIVLVLVRQAPVLTLATAAFLALSLVAIVVSTRRALGRWGEEEQALRSQLLQLLQQTFHALKEIKLLGRERYYYEGASDRQRALAGVQRRKATLTTASRLSIETVFVCGVLLVIAVTALRGHPGMDAIPLLGLYAYAGFRVIPSINRIVTYAGRMQYGAAAVDALHADLLAFTPREAAAEPPLTATGASTASPAPRITFADRLEVAGVSVDFGRGAPALVDVDLVVRRGESVGIVGPTGAGKSTLIDVVLGLLRPTTGRVTVDGVDIFTALRAWQNRIGYVPQAVYLLDDSLRRNVALGLPDAEIDDDRVRAALHMAQLDAVLAALPQGLDTLVGERGARLSGGERQRVAIARALYHDPELLVFDEATAALDMRTERELTRAIDSLHGRKTLLIVAHRMSTVQGCDRLVVLRAGRVEAEGAVADVLAHDPQLRALAPGERR